MRQMLVALLTLCSLGFLSPVLADSDEGFGQSENESTDEGVVENEGVFEDDDDIGGDDDALGYDASEFAAFEDDNLVEDDFGDYDADFDWEVEDEDWDDWYDADTGLWVDGTETDGFWTW